MNESFKWLGAVVFFVLGYVLRSDESDSNLVTVRYFIIPWFNQMAVMPGQQSIRLAKCIVPLVSRPGNRSRRNTGEHSALHVLPVVVNQESQKPLRPRHVPKVR